MTSRRARWVRRVAGYAAGIAIGMPVNTRDYPDAALPAVALLCVATLAWNCSLIMEARS